eukprot:TRINITY_DN6519_c0_g1_i2.p1 TRINITY_DN6519_c0_g1~~TRINITY_DN6519_c0_g1_i2.p1  ORF type:complete len:370 (+),score=84.75 TRINITY_DN6519_c0_g1_i2:95-1204(+)
MADPEVVALYSMMGGFIAVTLVALLQWLRMRGTTAARGKELDQLAAAEISREAERERLAAAAEARSEEEQAPPPAAPPAPAPAEQKAQRGSAQPRPQQPLTVGDVPAPSPRSAAAAVRWASSAAAGGGGRARAAAAAFSRWLHLVARRRCALIRPPNPASAAAARAARAGCRSPGTVAAARPARDLPLLSPALGSPPPGGAAASEARVAQLRTDALRQSAQIVDSVAQRRQQQQPAPALLSPGPGGSPRLRDARHATPLHSPPAAAGEGRLLGPQPAAAELSWSGGVMLSATPQWVQGVVLHWNDAECWGTVGAAGSGQRAPPPLRVPSRVLGPGRRLLEGRPVEFAVARGAVCDVRGPGVAPRQRVLL